MLTIEQIIEATDALGNATVRTYAKNSELRSETDANGNPVRYYDPTGNTIAEVWNTVMNCVTGGVYGRMAESCANLYYSIQAA